VAFYDAAIARQTSKERGGDLWSAPLQRMRHWRFRLSDFLGALFAQEKIEAFGAMQTFDQFKSSALGRLRHQCG
jgi:hypothetical protein